MCACMFRVCCCIHEWCEYVCAHVNLCTCLTVNLFFICVHTSIYCIYLLVVKDHERNHSDNVQLKTQSRSLLSMNL